MGRIRTIKPEFPQSETVGKLSREARLLFIQIWTIADDSGRARAASRMLASLLYPYDEDAPDLLPGWLAELERAGCVRRYQVGGDTYLDMPNWLKHQKIDRPSKSRLPGFDEGSREFDEGSTTDLGPGPGPGPGPRTSTKDHKKVPREDARADVLPPELIPDPRKAIFDDGLRWLAKAIGRPESGLRGMVGRWIKVRGDPEVAAALVAAQQNKPVDPIAWIEARLRTNGQRKPSDLDNRRATCEAIDEVVALAEARLGDVGGDVDPGGRAARAGSNRRPS